MSARPGQPVDESGAPITMGIATYANTTMPPEDDDDVLGHVADAMPDTDEEPFPKIVL
jgi:hypothetical protein